MISRSTFSCMYFSTILRTFICVLVLSLAASAQLSSLTAGRIDRTYGDNGVVFPGCCFQMIAYSDSIDLPDNKIAFLGTLNTKEGISVVITRHLVSGELDEKFGNKGIAVIRFGADIWSSSLTLQPDGKFVITGSMSASQSVTDFDFVVFRVLENGDIDTSFGNGGVFSKDFSTGKTGQTSSDHASGLVIQNDGKIVVGGVANQYISGDPFSRADSFATFIRLLPNGNLDTSFGNSGQILTEIGNNQPNTPNFRPTKLLQQEDGKIVAGFTVDREITSEPSTYEMRGLLMRHHSNGDIDTSFADNGLLNIRPDHWNGITSVILQPDGKLTIGASSAIVRVLPNGAFDSSFGANGTVTTTEVTGDVILQPNGKILFTANLPGSVIGVPEFQIGSISGLNTDGSTDIRFGRNGVSYFTHNQTPLGFGKIHLRDNYMIVIGIYNIPQSMTQMFTRFHLGK